MTSNNLLFIDIETVPTQEQWFKDYIAEKHADNPYTRSDKVAWFDDQGREELIARDLHAGGLNPVTGEVVAVSMARNHDEPIVFYRTLEQSEKALMADVIEYIQSSGFITFVGYNVKGFDIPFLATRQVMLRMEKQSNKLHYARDAQPWNSDVVFDIMQEINGWRSRDNLSFDLVCRAVGITGIKDDMDGSQVWQAMQDGRAEDVARYCRNDVANTQRLYYHLWS